MNHLGTKEIETSRLLLRRLNKNDSEAAFRNWMSDEEVTRYLTWKNHKNIEETKEILSIWENSYEDPRFYQWGIALKDTNELIGSISVVDIIDPIDQVSFGYCIGKKWWNQGYTSEALGALVSFFIKEVGANRLEARHDIENPNSGKVMEKCGLKYEGTLKEAEINNRGIVDVCVYGLTAKDY